MKTALFLILLSITGYAGVTRRLQLTAGSPMPGAYSASDTNSLVIASELLSMKSVSLVNNTDHSVQCLFVGNEKVTPVAVTNPAGTAISNGVSLVASEHVLLLEFHPSKALFCKSVGTAATGEFTVNAW